MLKLRPQLVLSIGFRLHSNCSSHTLQWFVHVWKERNRSNRFKALRLTEMFATLVGCLFLCCFGFSAAETTNVNLTDFFFFFSRLEIGKLSLFSKSLPKSIWPTFFSTFVRAVDFSLTRRCPDWPPSLLINPVLPSVYITLDCNFCRLYLYIMTFFSLFFVVWHKCTLFISNSLWHVQIPDGWSHHIKISDFLVKIV